MGRWSWSAEAGAASGEVDSEVMRCPEITRTSIRSYVGGGMLGQSGARCVTAALHKSFCRQKGEVDLK